MSVPAVRFHDHHPVSTSLRQAVLRGFSSSPKAIPTKFFYDRRGSELFDAICEQPEYYQTRTEMAILRRCADELAERVAERCQLLELGSGASRKIRLLLEALRPVSYLGIDISRDFLLESTRRLARDYPWLDVHAVWADFSARLDLPELRGNEHRLAFFPGSSIGNFEPLEAERLLGHVAREVGAGGCLLIGVDLKKDPALLDAAYNDAQGVTAHFNLNLLERIRVELGAHIRVENFEHLAFYDASAGRVEMHLVSQRAQRVRVADRYFHFEAGERIHTENSYKYTLEEFARLATRAGFRVDRTWTDDAQLFSVQLLQVD